MQKSSLGKNLNFQALRTLLSDEKFIFLIANGLFSLSSFSLTFLMPYLLPGEVYAQFVYLFSMMFAIVAFFEFGLTTTFVRNYQIESILTASNSFYVERVLFALILLLGLLPNNYINRFLSLDVDFVLNLMFYGLVLLQLIWQFNRARLNAMKKFREIFFRSMIILVLRVIGILYIFLSHGQIGMKGILLLSLVIPFAYELFEKTFFDLKLVFTRQLKKFQITDISKYLQFSVLIFLSAILFIYSTRYLMIIFKKFALDQFIAELGYALGFLGIINILNFTIRNFYISKLHPDNPSEIRAYLDSLKQFRYKILVIIGLSSIPFLCIVYFFRPDYFSINSIYILAAVLVSSSLTIYFGLFTLVTKTLGMLKLDIAYNIIRIVVAIFLVQITVPSNPLLAVLLVYNWIWICEWIFARHTRHLLLKLDLVPA